MNWMFNPAHLLLCTVWYISTLQFDALPIQYPTLNMIDSCFRSFVFNITPWGELVLMSLFWWSVIFLVLHPKIIFTLFKLCIIIYTKEDFKVLGWLQKPVKSNVVLNTYQVFRSHLKYLWWTDQTLNHQTIFLSITKCLHGLLLSNF